MTPVRKFGAIGMVILALTLAACTSPQSMHPKPDGMVMGSFVALGGLPGPARPLPGQVTAKNAAGHQFTVAVGKSGRFVLSLPAGVYQLFGRSPMVTGNGVEATCVVARPLRVKAGQEMRGVDVVCSLK